MPTITEVAKALRKLDFNGVNFYDINSILADPVVSKPLLDAMTEKARAMEPDMIVGLDARGFIFASVIADRLGVGMITCRKAGKLPGKTLSVEYGLEYRDQDVLQLQNEGYIRPGMRVVIADDLLATGGTASAACELVERLGAEVAGLVFAIELPCLGGRSKLLHYVIASELSVLGDGNVYPNVQYCVDVLSIDPQTQNLILIERLNGGGLAMPGGKIEANQSVCDAALAEHQQETGLAVQFEEYITTLADQGRDDRGEMVSIVVTATVIGGVVCGEAGKTKVLPWNINTQLPDENLFAFDHGEIVHAHASKLADAVLVA